MKKQLALTLLAILLVTASFGQSFEGIIIYDMVWRSKMPNVTDEQCTEMMGKVHAYYMKGGDYKSTGNGTFFQSQIYVNKDNKLYYKWSNSPTLFYEDCAGNTDEVITSKLSKGVIEILGYTCDELVLTCKTGVQKYYFSSDPNLKIDAKLFVNFNYGNWYNVVSKTNSVPLKQVIDNPQFTVESTATRITLQKLDSSLFQLPADAQIEKNPD